MNVLEMAFEGKMTISVYQCVLCETEDYLHLLGKVSYNFLDWQNVYIHFYM